MKKISESRRNLTIVKSISHFFNLSDTLGQFRRKGTAKWRVAKDIRGIPKDSWRTFEGVVLRKTKPVITEGHLLFLLILFLHYQLSRSQRLSYLQVRVLPPLFFSSLPQPSQETLSSSHWSRSRHRHPLQPPSATMSVVSLSLVLEFRSCSCGNVRTNLNKRQPVVCGVELHGHSNHR